MFTRLFSFLKDDSARTTSKHIVRTSNFEQELLCVGRGREGEDSGKADKRCHPLPPSPPPSDPPAPHSCPTSLASSLPRTQKGGDGDGDGGNPHATKGCLLSSDKKGDGSRTL